MYVHRTNNGKRISQYTCSQYSKVPVGKLCTTQHRINEDVVLSLVSEMLKAIAEYAKYDRAEFVRVVQEAQSSQQTAEVKKSRISSYARIPVTKGIYIVKLTNVGNTKVIKAVSYTHLDVYKRQEHIQCPHFPSTYVLYYFR